MRTGLNDGAGTARRPREIIAGYCVQVGQDACGLFFRVVCPSGQVSWFAGPYFVRAGNGHVSHGVAAVLVVFRYAIFRGKLS